MRSASNPSISLKLSLICKSDNGSPIASGQASGTAFYPVKSPGNYVFTATSENIIGSSSASNSIGIYPINFTESGLQTNSTWSVSVQGVSGQKLQFSAQTSSDHVSILVPNGRYVYNITVPPGYTVSQVNGSVNVNGAALTVSHSYSRPSFSFNSLSSYWEIAVVVAIAVIVAIIFMRKRPK